MRRRPPRIPTDRRSEDRVSTPAEAGPFVPSDPHAVEYLPVPTPVSCTGPVPDDQQSTAGPAPPRPSTPSMGGFGPRTAKECQLRTDFGSAEGSPGSGERRRLLRRWKGIHHGVEHSQVCGEAVRVLEAEEDGRGDGRRTKRCPFMPVTRPACGRTWRETATLSDGPPLSAGPPPSAGCPTCSGAI